MKIINKKDVLLCVLPLALLAGCGSSNTMEVNIEDGKVTTVVSVEKDCTVADALAAAELTVSAGDELSVAVNEAVPSDGQPIVISRKNQVNIAEDNGNSQMVTVMGGRVSDALAAAGIELGEYDDVDHNVDAYLANGMTINIIHRIPITLTVDGETTEVITSASTVEELLEEQDITVGSKDRLSKDKTASLTSGDKLVIERINVKKITETEEIEYETQTEYSGDMYAGESRVSQDGVNGEKDLTYEVTYVDGKESERKLVSEKVTKEPVPQIVVEGTKQQETSEPGGGDGSGRTIVSKVKNYDCDGSGHGWYTITYSDGTVEYVDF